MHLVVQRAEAYPQGGGSIDVGAWGRLNGQKIGLLEGQKVRDFRDRFENSTTISRAFRFTSP